MMVCVAVAAGAAQGAYGRHTYSDGDRDGDDQGGGGAVAGPSQPYMAGARVRSLPGRRGSTRLLAPPPATPLQAAAAIMSPAIMSPATPPSPPQRTLYPAYNIDPELLDGFYTRLTRPVTRRAAPK
jgi:hypothetical protein